MKSCLLFFSINHVELVLGKARKILKSYLSHKNVSSSQFVCPVLDSQVQKGCGHIGESSVKWMKRLEHLSWEEKLKELGLLSLEKTIFGKDLTNILIREGSV